MFRKNFRKLNIRIAAVLVCIVFAATSFSGCGGRKVVIEGPTQMFTDSCGREVEIPEKIEKSSSKRGGFTDGTGNHRS